MSRLTDKNFYVPEKIVGYSCDEICDKEFSCEECPIQEAFNKLAHYEDLEEQGRLIELPCKVGDTVWIVGTKCLSGRYELKCNEIASCDDCPLNHEFIVFDRKFDWRLFSIMQRNELHKEGRRLFVWGETVFVTKEDAEAELAELKEGEQ